MIGNGKSLEGFDFDRLIGEDTFAMNYIHFVYPWTEWRPKYYLSLEYRNNDPLWDIHLRVNASVAEKCWMDARLCFKSPVLTELENIKWIHRCQHHKYERANRTHWPEEWHLPELCTAFTGMSPMIQIADQMGYDEIYLLGCDLGFRESILDAYFAPYYIWPYSIPEDVEELDVDRGVRDDSILHVHKVAKKCANAKIFNATTGGQLEVYPRVNIDEVFKLKHYILGNGPSLLDKNLEKLDGITWGVNRIWKSGLVPDRYVRCEVPSYDSEHVQEDIREMVQVGTKMYLQKGFRGYTHALRNVHPKTDFNYFVTCDGKRHDWHLPEICAYGSVVHIAMQLAVLNGAKKLVLLGCDLGTPAHFYGNEGNNVDELLMDAHEIAKRCCPVPIERM